MFEENGIMGVREKWSCLLKNFCQYFKYISVFIMKSITENNLME